MNSLPGSFLQVVCSSTPIISPTPLPEPSSDARQQSVFDSGVPDWADWWDELREIDGFEHLIAERDRRFAGGTDNQDATAALHIEALRVAGFTESGTFWQYFDDYVVYGVR